MQCNVNYKNKERAIPLLHKCRSFLAESIMMGNGFNEYKRLIDQHLESHESEISENREDHKDIIEKLDKVIIELAEQRGKNRILGAFFGLIAGAISAFFVTLFKKL